MEKFKSDLLALPLEQIQISKTNPRKTFDEKKLKELSMSVAQIGVIQPVLVRPMNGAFELVCGERRYRAAKMAELDEIPANIRELTDDEAFELQIVENLERIDVHPLEEAEAFRNMLDTGRYTITDIAAKMVKPESFIAQRLKLNDLIPEIKQDFLHEELSIGHAVHIARLSAENQEGIHKFYKDRYDISGYGTQAQLQHEINNKTLDLGDARFPTNKDFIHAKACTACVHRSSNNPVLFEDMQGKDVCFKKVCYQSKTAAHIEEAAVNIMAEGSEIILATAYSPAMKEVVAAAASQSVPILEEGKDFKLIKTPDSDQKKVLYVGGNNMGMYADVWVPKKAQGATVEENTLLQQIDDLEKKAQRALEIDEEKIHEEIINNLKSEMKQHAGTGFNLESDFVDDMIFFFAIQQFGIYDACELLKKIGASFTLSVEKLEDVQEQLRAITPEQRKRFIVHSMLRNSGGSTNRKGVYGQIIRKLADSNSRIAVAAIESAQNAKAAERIKRTGDKLKALRTKEKAPKKEKLSKAVK